MAYIGRGLDKISNVEKLDNLTFDGSSTSFALQKGGSSFVPSSANNILLSIDGVVQAGNFTVSGSTIDFGVAPSGSSTCDFILHYGVGVITTPSDGSVTGAKIASSAVDLTSKVTGTLPLANGGIGATTLAGAGISLTPAFAVRLTSDQSVSSGAITKVQLTTEDVDTDGCFDNATNYRFTPTTAGKYFFYAMGRGGASSGTLNYCNVLIRKNGTAGAGNTFTNSATEQYTSPGNTANAGVNTILDMNGTTDYVEMYMQIGGTSPEIKHDNNGSATMFGGYKLMGV